MLRLAEMAGLICNFYLSVNRLSRPALGPETHRIVGLVVKASASGAAGPGLDSHLRGVFPIVTPVT